MADPRLLALDMVMPLIARRLQLLEERVQALGGSPDPQERLRGVYRGIWEAGRVYRRGEFVTRSGGLWHANADTLDTPGAGRTDWVLVVKRGKAGNLGK